MTRDEVLLVAFLATVALIEWHVTRTSYRPATPSQIPGVVGETVRWK